MPRILKKQQRDLPDPVQPAQIHIHLSSRQTRVPSGEQLTRQFYERFKQERLALLQHIQGKLTTEECESYVSLLLGRLLFLAFLQKKGFLDNDPHYLLHHFHRHFQEPNEDNYYQEFLLPLFHTVLGQHRRTPELQARFGNIPYLGGELFTPTDIEQAPTLISIPNHAMLQLLTFFAAYEWNLDEDNHAPNQLTPGILGYILEKYVNQQQIGAYYTKEDVTAYIAKNTIIPYFFEAVGCQHPHIFQSGAQLWQSIYANPDHYIYPDVRRGDYLIGESLQEYAKRRTYYRELHTRLQCGQIQTIDDFITYNLDIQQYALDVLWNLADPDVLVTCLRTLRSITILDPTCGSGAFLFAALKVLEPLYTACIGRIEKLLARGLDGSEFDELLQEMQLETHRTYHIRKMIIAHNLYGVDLHPQAITICKLRFFLALIAGIKNPEEIEPLPHFHQHIRTGNALVGFSTPLDGQPGTNQAKLNKQLAQEYEVDIEDHAALEQWEKTYQPFHWNYEFADIMRAGGFHVIIGNPPYVEYHEKTFPYTLRNFTTSLCGNLYPCTVERSHQLLAPQGRQGMILPLAAFATRNMQLLLDGFLKWFAVTWVSFYHFRPAMLFSGSKKANIPTAICLAKCRGQEQRYSSRLIKWQTEEREQIFPLLTYCRITTPRDPANRYYYPKFGQDCENTIMQKVLSHTRVQHYRSTSPTQNTMFYRSAGGLYWKVFTNFPWPYQVTSNKRCYFQDEYDADIFVALFNSSLFWWYYTTTFDTFNLKDYMLFGFHFSYPTDKNLVTELKRCCQQLMDDFQHNARHLMRGQTKSYTIYARKSKDIIDEIDKLLARHYELSEQELAFILNYDLKYRMGQTAEDSIEQTTLPFYG